MFEKIKFETARGSYTYKDHPEFFTTGPTLSNGLWSATLDLENLGIYKNGDWVKVTMQYKNHDKSIDANGNYLYKTVTKTIKAINVKFDEFYILFVKKLWYNKITNKK